MQMHSPAYSAQLANSISNPGSIMSAAPESPSSSIRSPSVRSNYSLRLINSTPDPFQTQPNNNGNSEHSYSLDAFIHQVFSFKLIFKKSIFAIGWPDYNRKVAQTITIWK
jgi:hypothetical protein